MRYLVFKGTGMTFWWRSETRKLGSQQVLLLCQMKKLGSLRLRLRVWDIATVSTGGLQGFVWFQLLLYVAQG